MSSHHRVGPPTAPPPPILSSRSKGSRRSRSQSRSRSPRNSRNNRFRSNSRERDRGGRRPSPPPAAYSGRGGSTRPASFRKPGSTQDSSRHSSSQARASHPGHLPPHESQQQSISLIAGDGPPPILRKIQNPDDVKIPRRACEGARPIFDRPELKEAMYHRQRIDNNEENPPVVPVQEPLQSQRVIAIIREPIGGHTLDGYRGIPGLSLKESSFASSRHSQLRPISPGPVVRPSMVGPKSNYRPSISPVGRDKPRRASRERSIDRKRDLLYERERTRDVDLREKVRDKEVRVRSRSRERISRFNPEPPNLSSAPRSRSPVKILRERPDRRSRSRSVTPPPMPEQMRRQYMERDLRNKLSRPLTNSLPNKYASDHDTRGPGSYRGSRGFRGGFRGRGFTRGRGFIPRAQEDSRSRGFWEHDMFEKEGVDDNGGDSKPNRD